MKFNLKKKIELSKILEKVEVAYDSKSIISLLDEYHSNPKAHVIGITGPPGVGKSSLINKMVSLIQKKRKTVGVIAVDPSSSNSKGALLGDRTRFTFDSDENVFVRSMATKNYLGGVSEMTFPTITIMRAIFDYLIVETVGVGQSEIGIKDLVDSVILCVQPGSGDTIQFMKSGVFEIPNIVLITKSDLDKLPDITFSELSGSLDYFKKDNEKHPTIIKVSSYKNIGFDKLFETIKQRWSLLKKTNELNLNRINQAKEWIKKRIEFEFGKYGLDKIKNEFDYKTSPFKTLYTIKKDFTQ